MKKSIIFLALAAAGFAFTSCEDEKEPVYNIPTEFVLNTPPMAESVYILHAGDVVEFTCSQPNYGYSAVTNYAVDFSTEEEFVDATEDAPANYFTVTPVNSTSAKLQLSAEDIAKGICTRHGVETFVDYPEGGIPAEAAYVRVRAWLTGVASSAIVSNTVALGGIEVYNPYPAVPGQIYIVGALNGWTEPASSNQALYDNWKLTETGVGTNVYVGSFEVPAGEQYFRFYQSLSGWGEDGKLPSIGPAANDGDNTEVTITAEPSEWTAVPGKGAWYTSSDWAGGPVTFTVDLSDKNNFKVTMALGAVVKEAYAYIIGSQAGWAEPNEGNASIYEDWKLVDVGETGVFKGTFTIPAGDMYFRVYPALTGWGPTPYAAAQNDGENISIALDSPLAYTQGEGCWILASEGQEYTFILDTNEGTMTISYPELPEAYVYLVGSQADWKEPNADNEDVYDNWKLVDKGLTGVYTATFDIPAGDLYFRVYPALTGWGDTPYAAAQNDGDNKDIALDKPLKYVTGVACWVYKTDGGALTFTLDTNAKTMTISK
ncbi:MAG: SusE domain-containing protein [Muribaculaceae bacterium]|nr:SusE domain-containing protein [Muribaculaceae bacterium]